MNCNNDMLLYIKNAYLIYVLLLISYCIVYILHTTPGGFPISSHDSITYCTNVIISPQYMYIHCLNGDLVLNDTGVNEKKTL